MSRKNGWMEGVGSVLGLWLSSLLCLSATPAEPGFPHYAILEIGTLSGLPVATSPGSMAFDLTENGHVVGVSITGEATPPLHAYLWQSGVLQDLLPLAGNTHSQAFALQESGAVYGISFDLGQSGMKAVRWDAGQPTMLGAFLARGVNASGVVVGEQPTDSTGLTGHAVRWFQGQLNDLGTLGGSHSSAIAVSDGGEVVGFSWTSGDAAVRATLWIRGNSHDLGTLGGESSKAYALNDLGQIVGVADDASQAPHACLFEVDPNGNVLSRTDLGHLGDGYSEALGINGAGEIVGSASSRAFYYSTASGTMIDLNGEIAPGNGWQLISANAINERGWIAGCGVRDGLLRAYLLIPWAQHQNDRSGQNPR